MRLPRKPLLPEPILASDTLAKRLAITAEVKLSPQAEIARLETTVAEILTYSPSPSGSRQQERLSLPDWNRLSPRSSG